MSTERMMRFVGCLLVSSFVSVTACGSSDDGDDDDLPASTNTTTITTGQTAGSTGNNGNGFTSSGSNTTGGTLIQDNDRCDEMEPADGEPCGEDGLICSDASGRQCVCGGTARDPAPDGEWACRGSNTGAGGAGGESGAGGQAGQGQGGEGN